MSEQERHQCQGGGRLRRCRRIDADYYAVADLGLEATGLRGFWLCPKHAARLVVIE